MSDSRAVNLSDSLLHSQKTKQDKQNNTNNPKQKIPKKTTKKTQRTDNLTNFTPKHSELSIYFDGLFANYVYMTGFYLYII